MNIYFSKVLKAGERQREFNFSQISHADDKRFKVDVPDDKGQRLAFTMLKDANGQWRTDAPDLPEWILAIESALNQAIVDNELSEIPAKRK